MSFWVTDTDVRKLVQGYLLTSDLRTEGISAYRCIEEVGVEEVHTTIKRD